MASRRLILIPIISIALLFLYGILTGWYWWVIPIRGFMLLPRPLYDLINLFLVLSNSVVINIAASLIVLKIYLDSRVS